MRKLIIIESIESYSFFRPKYCRITGLVYRQLGESTSAGLLQGYGEPNGCSKELTESIEKYNKLIIEPVPDSLLRVTMHVKKVNKKVKIKEQELPTFERIGFVAVEWGGTELIDF